jgi:hypothetical protein
VAQVGGAMAQIPRLAAPWRGVLARGSGAMAQARREKPYIFKSNSEKKGLQFLTAKNTSLRRFLKNIKWISSVKTPSIFFVMNSITLFCFINSIMSS